MHRDILGRDQYKDDVKYYTHVYTLVAIKM